MTAIVRTRTARKSRDCERCHEPIEPGEQYEDERMPPWGGDGANESPYWRRLTCHVRAYPDGIGCDEAAAYHESAVMAQLAEEN